MIRFETVHTMTDFYDGPRGGVADFCGLPHVYESVFADDAGYSDKFLLSPISDDLLQLALEEWAIWLRWEAAFHRGETSHETHPALPGDRYRYEDLRKLLGKQLTIDADNFVVATAEFRGRAEALEVCWSLAEDT